MGWDRDQTRNSHTPCRLARVGISKFLYCPGRNYSSNVIAIVPFIEALLFLWQPAVDIYISSSELQDWPKQKKKKKAMILDS